MHYQGTINKTKLKWVPNVETIGKYKITKINRFRDLVEKLDNKYQHIKIFSSQMETLRKKKNMRIPVRDGNIGRS